MVQMWGVRETSPGWLFGSGLSKMVPLTEMGTTGEEESLRREIYMVLQY
jgi:hypothetical protein